MLAMVGLDAAGVQASIRARFPEVAAAKVVGG
jgi:hypothetical protein